MAQLILENPHLHLEVNPNQGSWSAHSRTHPGAGVTGSRLGVLYRKGRQTHRGLANWQPYTSGTIEIVDSNHGPRQQVRYTVGPDPHDQVYELTFALAAEDPFMFWKVRVENHSQTPITVQRIEMLRVGFKTISRADLAPPSGRAGTLKLSEKAGELAFFANGWQSWNHSGAYGFYERQRRSRLGPITRPLRANPGTPQTGRIGHFGSDLFGVIGDRTYRTGLLAGFLSQHQHFGSLETYQDPFIPALQMWANGDDAHLAPGKVMETDWACLSFLHLDEPDPLGAYIEAVAIENGLTTQSFSDDIPSGWCSWYQYFQNISAEIIQQNVEAAAALRSNLPLDFIQIDDGFQSQVGDWLAFQENFPDGPQPLAAEIHQQDFTPGIWLAPFIVHPRSRLAAEHPDWLLRNRWGKAVNAGFMSRRNVSVLSLDITKPDALDYTCEVIHEVVHKWGFPYLKLDFLYAAALKGVYRDPTKTRAQVLTEGLRALRATAGPDTYLIGCGCPLGPAIGIVNAMRIGADVAPEWHPKYFGTHFFFKSEPDFPAARNAIQNALTRASMHRRWWINDPDCLLVRPDSNLTLDEVQTLASVIALTGGSLLLSDELANLPPERLEIARALLPLIGKSPHVLDLFDHPTPTRLQLDLEGATGRWHLLALFNWQDSPAAIEVHPEEFLIQANRTYAVRDFWRGETRLLTWEGLIWEDIPAHGCLLLAARLLHTQPQYLGSNLHISQGLEVAAWEHDERVIELELRRPGRSAGHVDLRLPNPPRDVTVDEKKSDWEDLMDDIFRFPVAFTGQCRVKIVFSD
jgi:alpha-galactosidase